jgi:multimeric flavodoxin WrbA
MKMKIIAVNGSPRKEWNTHILLNKALEGAKSAGAEVELINLYDLDYKGCHSCMACKVKDGKSLGHCAVNDALKAVLEKIDHADGLILGSPIYWGDVTAQMRAFIERLLFQYTNFDNGQSLFKSHLKTGFIYTMNAPAGYLDSLYEKYAGFLGMHFEYVGTVESAETLQVEDYSKYHLGFFDGDQRHERREKFFPKDCQKAFDLGKKIVTDSNR